MPEAALRTGGGVAPLAVYALARRELRAFVRQRNRVIGALAQPILFWLLLGGGLHASFAAPSLPGLGYMEYFFPGTVVLILLFTAIFTTISVIEDRNSGFLQSVMVAPVSTPTLVLGKLGGTTILAVGQAGLFFVLAPVAGIDLTLGTLLRALPVLVLLAIALAGLGLAIAWRMDSTQGFHAIMTAFLMPLWILSGAVFPATGAPQWLSIVMALNPLSYGLSVLRHFLYMGRPEALGAVPGLAVSLTVVTGFTIAMVSLAIYVVGDRSIQPGR